MVWFAVLLLFFLRSPTVKGADPPGGYYTTRYDHLDIENILNQKRLVHYYAACLLDKGPCTPQGIEFKSILPEAIKTNCLRCTEKQRVVTLRSIRRLRKEYPDIWKQLEASWDPTGAYVKRLEESVNKPIPIPSPSASNNEENLVPLPNRFGDSNEHKRVPEDITSKRTVETSTQTSPIIKLPTSTEQTSIKQTSTKQTSLKPTSINPTSTPQIDLTSTTSTTLKLLVTTLQPNTSPKFTTSTSIYRVTNRIIPKPFSSIGPNLVIPNPKALIDKVISTAGAVLNSVTNTVTNTVVTVFKVVNIGSSG